MQFALCAAVLASIVGQSSGQPFAGIWTADQQGRPIVRLELRVNGGTLVGSIQLADIHVDPDGKVETVLSELSPAAPLIAITRQNRALGFSRRDGADLDHFELIVIGDGAAELRFVPSYAERQELADSGVPLPQPIRLARTER